MKKFTKSDLIQLTQTETVVVKQRNGNRKIVLGNALCGNNNNWSSLSNFNRDLTNNVDKEFDISSVYKTSEGTSLNVYLQGNCLTPVWERTEQTEAQKEMDNVLSQISKLQEQAKALQKKL